MCTAIGTAAAAAADQLAKVAIRSMEAAAAATSVTSPAKEAQRNSWRRKPTNIFVALPTLLALYFVGAGVALVLGTRTFVNSFSHDDLQAPVQLFLALNSRYAKPAQAVLEELQAPPHRDADDLVVQVNATVTANITNATSSETSDFLSFDGEPEFMETPVIKKSKLEHAAVLQHKLRHMSSVERRRWLHENWSAFKILQEDNVSAQFDKRMREFLCHSNETAHLAVLGNANQTDEAHLCAPNPSSFCAERFFLTWISPVASFSARERLGLESIFKHHARACVVLLSRTMDSDAGRAILAPLRARGYRVMAVTPDVRSLFSGIPAARWLSRLRDGTGDPGCINLMQNLSNLMRLAALYKYGGAYLDTDVIVLRSFAPLRNVVGMQSRDNEGRWTRLNNAVLVFDRGHPIVLEFLREFVERFDGSRWGWNGPYLVSRVVDKVLQVQKWSNCSDVAVLPLEAFYPVNWIDIVKFFRKPTKHREIQWQAKEVQWIMNGTYSIHLWNKRSNHLRVEPGSIMETLFKRSCLFCKQVSDS